MRTILGGLGRRIPRPTPAMGVALLALLIAASGVAVAIPSADGTISACRDNRSGALRVINTEATPPQTCSTSKETLLSWKDGITGKVANSELLDGKDSAQLVTDTTPTYGVMVSEVAGNDLFAEPTASCDSGDRLQYGGHTDLSPSATVMESVGNNAHSWTVQINAVNTGDGVTTSIRCYDFPPLRP